MVGDRLRNRRSPHRIAPKQILQSLGVEILIDDAYHNALDCGIVDPPIRALLFGDYQWNKRPSNMLTQEDRLSYQEKAALEAEGSTWWTRDDIEELPAFISRASGWEDVVAVLKGGSV